MSAVNRRLLKALPETLNNLFALVCDDQLQKLYPGDQPANKNCSYAWKLYIPTKFLQPGPKLCPLWDMSQTEDHPGSRLRQKCVGGVMDGELRQQRSAAGLSRASAGHLAAVSAPFFSPFPLLPEPWAWKALRDDSRCETSHSWTEWAFVSWLITADSWLPTAPRPSHPHTLSPSHSSVCSALSCRSLVGGKKKEKPYQDDRRRLLNLSSGKKPLCALGCPCRARLPKNIINASAGKHEQQWLGITSKCVWEINSEFLFFFFAICFKATLTLKPSGSNYDLKKKKLWVHLSCKRLNLCGHDAMFNKWALLTNEELEN